MDIEILREQTIKQLEYNYAHGNIDLDELEKHLELAVHTSLAEDLTRITVGLDPIPEDSAEPTDGKVNLGHVRADETYWGILSGITKKGRWKPARDNNIFVFMGGATVDFSEALLPPGVTDFSFFCVMGGIDIVVPEGINVEVNGLPIMGGIDNHLPDDYNPDHPTIRFHGTVLMGGVDVKRPKRKKRRRNK